MSSPFQFYEIVRVNSNEPTVKQINGLEGTILGFSEGKDRVSYSVFIHKLNETWFLSGNDLISTGKMDKRGNFYDGSRLTVSTDGDVLE
jgi:hypothetical protein